MSYVVSSSLGGAVSIEGRDLMMKSKACESFHRQALDTLYELDLPCGLGVPVFIQTGAKDYNIRAGMNHANNHGKKQIMRDRLREKFLAKNKK
jgi:hypothetical protein